MVDKNSPIYVFLLNAGIITPETKMNDDVRNVQLFESAVESAQLQEKNHPNTRLEVGALAYLAWSEEFQRITRERNKHTERLKDIQTHCSHSFRREPGSFPDRDSVLRCVACRKIG